MLYAHLSLLQNIPQQLWLGCILQARSQEVAALAPGLPSKMLTWRVPIYSNDSLLHSYKMESFFFFNQLQSCQQLLAAEEELVSIWLHPGSHKQLVDRGHHPKRVHNWWALPCMPSAGSVTWIQREDLRQTYVALTRNNRRRLYCVWQGKMPNKWEMKISRNFEPSFAAFAAFCYVCFLMH